MAKLIDTAYITVMYIEQWENDGGCHYKEKKETGPHKIFVPRA